VARRSLVGHTLEAHKYRHLRSFIAIALFFLIIALPDRLDHPRSLLAFYLPALWAVVRFQRALYTSRSCVPGRICFCRRYFFSFLYGPSVFCVALAPCDDCSPARPADFPAPLFDVYSRHQTSRHVVEFSSMAPICISVHRRLGHLQMSSKPIVPFVTCIDVARAALALATFLWISGGDVAS